ncbi:MAG: hypothetical protein KJO49_13650 [Bacteroidia bacterium]|nr:hypothetical protein [Bacteroidia bacterium]NNF82292.1 hypothetical protein [Flavobacteriaceae bacterium]NNK71377.1 hypothetical protein [Flavobacteriaceae bacterium]NNL79617.1 hypothetical protein [Flavobacteriaceae bacterium]
MKNNLYKLIMLLTLGGLMLSCVAEEGPILIELEEEEPISISFASDIQPIFSNNCVQCHDETHPTGLNLQEGFSYDLLVNVSSNNYSPNLRIEPFSPENSVLWHKINDDGVFGGGMPPNGSLSNFEKQKIEEWILQGAQDN